MEQVPISTDVAAMQEAEKLANLVAENAAALYKGYLMSVERCRQLGLNQNRFESCLLRHKVLFVEGLNPENDILGRTPRISVEQYLLQQGKELKQTFRIADIKLFGDFEHF